MVLWSSLSHQMEKLPTAYPRSDREDLSRSLNMELPPITSSQNRLIGKVRRYLARPRECRREGIMVADGVHLVREAMTAGLDCVAIFATVAGRDPELVKLREEAASARLPVYPVLDHLFRVISPVETPQGIVGLFRRPQFKAAQVWHRPRGASLSGHIIVAHELQDPTNLGSVTRSALAGGIKALITTPNTVDPYHHRALRASMGAAFHLPIVQEQPIHKLITTLRNVGFRTAGLAPKGDVELTSLDPAIPTALVLGSEGSGLDKAVLDRLDLRVRIPMQPGVESLGVAAAGAVAIFWLQLASRNGRAIRPDR